MKARRGKQSQTMGSGHVVPEGMSKAEYVKLKRKWDAKLEKSLAADGLADIEQSDDDGYVGPMFSQYHGMTSNAASSHVMRRHTPEKERFYYLCGVFLTCFKWDTLTPDNYKELPKNVPPQQFKQMWELYCSGLSTKEVFERLPAEWGHKRWFVRDAINTLRGISAFWNRHDPNGGNIDSDF